MSREKPIEPPKGCPHQDLFARGEIVTRVGCHPAELCPLVMQLVTGPRVARPCVLEGRGERAISSIGSQRTTPTPFLKAVRATRAEPQNIFQNP